MRRAILVLGQARILIRMTPAELSCTNCGQELELGEPYFQCEAAYLHLGCVGDWCLKVHNYLQEEAHSA